MPRSLCSLLPLAVLVAACGGGTLRSPECDEGKPVVATGRIVLEQESLAVDVSSAVVSLQRFGEGRGSSVGTASREAPLEFPLSFELCADLSAEESGPPRLVVVEVKRLRGNLPSLAGTAALAQAPAVTAGLEIRPEGGNDSCSCGPTCDRCF